MNTTPKPEVDRTIHEPPRLTRRVPEPQGDDEDISQWKLVGRGTGVRQGPPLIGLELDLDREQSDWLRAESKRTGLDYFQVVKKLIDEARTRNAR